MTQKALRLATALFAAWLAVTALPRAQGSGEVALRAAMETENVKGDLRAAIEQYKKIAAGTDRAIVVRALFRMAECYQKLGDVEAQKIYQQLVREYADQQEAVAIARARLAGSNRAASSGGVALRKVWTDTNAGGVSYPGGISPDGRYLSYAGRFNTAVILRDLIEGTERALNGGDWGTVASAISKGGSQVAYDKCAGVTGNSPDALHCELWASPLGAGSLSPREAFERLPILTVWPLPLGNGNLPPARRLFANDDVINIWPHDWSPDDTRIAVAIRRKDRTAQVGWVGVADGSLHVLKSVDWRGPIRMFFSPDGSDIAFDLPASDTTDDRDVFVLAADGSRETGAVVSQGNDAVIGWSPDGRHLLFASDRNGTMGLWAVPFADHRPHGASIVLKPDIGSVLPLGVTRSGALYWSAPTSDIDIEIVQMDLTTGKQTASPVKPIKRFTGTNTQPAWSSDGKWLAYRSVRGSAEFIGIRSNDTGEVRELRPPLSHFQGLTWAPDGQSLVVWGSDLKGREGVFRIDARAGQVTPIVMPAGETRAFYWSPDGTRLYYPTRSPNGATMHEQDLSSGTERVFGTSITGNVLSPDGRWIAGVRTEPPTGSAAVVLIPVDGGESRTLLRLNRTEGRVNNILWTPDGSALLALKMTGTTEMTSDDNELWYVPVNGATPRKLDVRLNRVVTGGQGRIQLHPDGRQLAFVSGRYPVVEVWVLENFLPALTAKR